MVVEIPVETDRLNRARPSRGYGSTGLAARNLFEFCNDLQRWGLGSALLRWLGVARSIFSEPRQLPDSRAAVLAQAKAELARRERERPRARQLYSSRARTRSSN